MAVSVPRRVRRSYRRGGARWTLARGVGHLAFERAPTPPGLTWRLAPRYYRRVLSFDTGAYDAPLEPFKVESVDPDRITHITMREYPPWGDKERLFGAVRGGDWDRRDPDAELPYEFAEKPIYRIFRARFVEKKEWTEIDGIRRRLRSVEEGKTTWRGCTTREDVLERCAYCDALYDGIRREGFRRQRELEPGTRSEGFLPAIGNEVLVDIGRDGELLHVGGMHRLAIAKLLGLSEIPVAFLVRHREWMTRRDRIHARGDREALPDHPDLRELRVE